VGRPSFAPSPVMVGLVVDAVALGNPPSHFIKDPQPSPVVDGEARYRWRHFSGREKACVRPAPLSKLTAVAG
jgi:hypothetical protein